MKFLVGLLVAACCLNVASSAVFGPTGQWLRNPSKATSNGAGESTENGRLANVLRIRGGDAEKKSTDKITGCCIGIDLGTTYR